MFSCSLKIHHKNNKSLTSLLISFDPSMKQALFFITVLISATSFSQRNTVGTFFDHLPYNQGQEIELLGPKVYCQSGPGLFSYDTEDESIERLNTISGLTEMGVSCISAHAPSGTLVIGYQSGGLDFIRGNKILNRADIIRANVISDKAINSISFLGDTAIICTGFGILLYNMVDVEALGTLLIGPNESYQNLNSSIVLNNMIYASSANGLWLASLDADLSDFRSWQQDSSILNENINAVFSFNQNLFINIEGSSFQSDSVFMKNGAAWEYFELLSNETNSSFRSYNDRLLVAQSTALEMFDTEWNNIGRVFDYQSGISPSPSGGVWDGDNNQLWVADINQGLIKSNDAFNNEILTPSSPATGSSQSIYTLGERVFVAAGSRTNNWLNTFNQPHVFVLDNNEWGSINRLTVDGLSSVVDLIDVNSDNGEDIYVASYGGGLLHFKDEQLIETYDNLNSSLVNIIGDSTYVAVSGLDFDSDGNLWVGNSRSSAPLHVRTNDGDWAAMPISGFSSADFSGRLLHTSWGHVWLSLPKRGVLVYDYNDTPLDFQDDQYKILSKAVSDGNLPSLEVEFFQEDENGEIWVGTNLGLRVFFSPRRVFDEGSQGDASEILIQQENYTEVLFDQESITGIAVDDANRKWIGTQNSGLFLLSPDGKEQIRNFNKRNSPLFSDRIISLGLMGPTGELFIGTDQGIMSFKSDATTPYVEMENLFVYPNPVKPKHTGLIAIKNLSDGADITIVDASGALVYQTTAQGGQATWDGRDNGRRDVANGVYLVLAASPDGSVRGKTKILIAR